MNVADLFSLKGNVALVTGGSSGIGLMITQGYLEAGAKVYISSRKKDVCNKMAKWPGYAPKKYIIVPAI
ncbi:MAG: SDR family NAD(P)-dependent oxidoreductase [Thermodesulfobacteriota bacterium]|nr:SDR family NAD(P)-dependent oxidoreductase [Thermodesulfobacteriota bacterium]